MLMVERVTGRSSCARLASKGLCRLESRYLAALGLRGTQLDVTWYVGAGLTLPQTPPEDTVKSSLRQKQRGRSTVGGRERSGAGAKVAPHQLKTAHSQ